MKLTIRRCVQNLIVLSVLSLVSILTAQAEEPPTFALKWGSEGAGDGQFDDARRLVVDGVGNVWVADYWNTRIQKFSPTGGLLQKFIPG